MRSHPPSLIKIARRTLVDECGLERGERILVAVSGGGDSTALLHVLSVLAPKLGVVVEAHGVDHGLRAEAGAELDLAEEAAAHLGVPFRRTVLRVRPGGNLQARARDARREALLSAARACTASRIATAHHANDRAETVLIRLLNGARASSLGVVPPVDGPFLRPFVRAPKGAIVRHLERHGLRHATDPSNEDRRFLRVRVRLELLPLLETLSPAVVDHLNGLADELARAPIPPLLDETGHPLALRQAHLRELRRALSLGRGARIRLTGDREIVVDPASLPRSRPRPDGEGDGERAPRTAERTEQANRVRVVAAQSLHGFRPNGQKGDAKSEKRG